MNSHINALHVLDIFQEIGNIAECNGHFTDGLFRQIEATGKPIEAFTIAELLNTIRDYSALYNGLYADSSLYKSGVNND